MISLEQLHPMVLHFPIVFAVTLAILDLIALVRGLPLGGRSPFAMVALGTSVAAGASAALAAGLGDVAAEIAVARGVPDALIETHEGLGMTTAALLGTWAVLRVWGWWRNLDLTGGRKLAIVGVDLAILGLVALTAHFGGQLVYEHGVNVVASL